MYKTTKCYTILLPNETPNLCVDPTAMSQPNSPGGRSIVNANRSVAQMARA